MFENVSLASAMTHVNIRKYFCNLHFFPEFPGLRDQIVEKQKNPIFKTGCVYPNTVESAVEVWAKRYVRYHASCLLTTNIKFATKSMYLTHFMPTSRSACLTILDAFGILLFTIHTYTGTCQIRTVRSDSDRAPCTSVTSTSGASYHTDKERYYNKFIRLHFLLAASRKCFKLGWSRRHFLKSFNRFLISIGINNQDFYVYGNRKYIIGMFYQNVITIEPNFDIPEYFLEQVILKIQNKRRLNVSLSEVLLQ